jgi:hypothetical protein
MVRLDNGKVVCGGWDTTIRLFDPQFDKNNSKPLSNVMQSALIVDNYIYCGLGDRYVVMFDKNLEEINKVKLSGCVNKLYCVNGNNSKTMVVL